MHHTKNLLTFAAAAGVSWLTALMSDPIIGYALHGLIAALVGYAALRLRAYSKTLENSKNPIVRTVAKAVDDGMRSTPPPGNNAGYSTLGVMLFVSCFLALWTLAGLFFGGCTPAQTQTADEVVTVGCDILSGLSQLACPAAGAILHVSNGQVQSVERSPAPTPKGSGGETTDPASRGLPVPSRAPREHPCTTASPRPRL